MLKELSIKSIRRVELINITDRVKNYIREEGINNGIAVIFTPHTTAGITINEDADPDVISDIINEINKIIPFSDGYQHFEGNSAAHIKSSFFGASETVIIENNELLLGRWQGIYFCEFDGPRTRKVFIKIIGG
jgi:secondary thiamine-phosphate synthase enzyme